MPEDKPLSPAEKAIFKQWILDGAAWGDDETIDKPESSHTTTASETGGVSDHNSHSIVNSTETKPAVYQRTSDADATESVACVSNTVSKDTIASASTASDFAASPNMDELLDTEEQFSWLEDRLMLAKNNESSANKTSEFAAGKLSFDIPGLSDAYALHFSLAM